ncbi:hypothetical protein LYNGBM3L_17190 [Moorena producens 3L]|uniref:Uncharacterized protein n=1 Tax=Moorena producens 3L TaxID=489825 RepID=F4XLY5_9CYAN|nr:hypothetical protein LYNGBM3L_55220 [Moorena producens 3L]EGJ34398.1 hypothetical protein LYNGBM3L_17190 [Moorena producens 3L]
MGRNAFLLTWDSVPTVNQKLKQERIIAILLATCYSACEPNFSQNNQKKFLGAKSVGNRESGIGNRESGIGNR